VYKEINKTSFWEDISRKEYGISSQAYNLKRLNNNKEDGSVIVYDKQNINNSSNKQNINNNLANTTNKPELIVNDKPITEYMQIDLFIFLIDINVFQYAQIINKLIFFV
jgi:hypothetical protein